VFHPLDAVSHPEPHVSQYSGRLSLISFEHLSLVNRSASDAPCDRKVSFVIS
jgi:hypothetical protein